MKTLNTVIVGIYLIFPTVIALQYTSSKIFVSKNTLWCGQAQADVAKDALNLYKSMPRGKLYESVTINDAGSSSCEELGYNFVIGEDPCYPGLKNFYRSEKEKNQFLEEFNSVVTAFAAGNHFTYNETALLDACMCKKDSQSIQYWGDTCKRTQKLQALIEHPVVHTFISTDHLWCGQARADVAEDALSLYKSMPRGKLYDVMLNDTGDCVDLGYNFEQGEDPCYPGLQTFFRDEEDKNQFLDYLKNAVREFGERYNFTMNDTDLLDACMCKDKSYAINNLGKSCERATQLKASIDHGDTPVTEPSVTQTSDPTSVTQSSVVRAFISLDGRWCGQARAGVAEDALGLYKSMPRGRLYNGITIQDGNCEDLGYTFAKAEDPCYPGLHTSFRNNKEQHEFLNAYQVALRDYGENYNFTIKDASLLDGCKCKNGSESFNWWGNSCHKVTEFRMLAKPVAMRTFVSMNKKFCGQAPPRIAEGALALFKAMPRGKLYTDKLIHTSDIQSCEDLGYKHSVGEDPCYPGLQTFYRNEKEKNQFVEDLQATLRAFAKRYNVTYDDATLMDSCTCHVDSFALNYRGQSCNLLNKIEASWVHHEPNTGKKIACAGGPFVLATRTLAVMKTSEEMPMHQSDQIAPVDCEAFGFPYRYPHADKCFTGLHAWSVTEDAVHDALTQETRHALDRLVNGGFKNFITNLGLDSATFGNNSFCKCSPQSNIGRKTKGKCDLPGARNHIRDWWKE